MNSIKDFILVPLVILTLMYALYFKYQQLKSENSLSGMQGFVVGN
jgi:hypothetical protein